MIATTEIFHAGDSSSTIIAYPEGRCGFCGHASPIFRNRDGQTRCESCDAAYLRDKEIVARTQGDGYGGDDL